MIIKSLYNVGLTSMLTGGRATITKNAHYFALHESAYYKTVKQSNWINK